MLRVNHLLCTSLLVVCCFVPAHGGALSAARLRADWMPQPMVLLDALGPRLTWEAVAAASSWRGLIQTAYRAQVCTSSACDAVVCDTGTVSGSSNAAHCAPPNATGAVFYWRVLLNSSMDVDPAQWSAPAMYRTAPALTSAWISPDAAWPISRPVRFRAVANLSTLDGTLLRATAYTAGLGYYELYMNGSRIDGKVFSAWTEYHARVLYDTWDVSDVVAAALQSGGQLAIGLRAGPGPWGHFWKTYGSTRLSAWLQLDVDMQTPGAADGCAVKRWTIGARNAKSAVQADACTYALEPAWFAAQDMMSSDWYFGEDVDGRLAALFDGWDTLAYVQNPAVWSAAVSKADLPTSVLAPTTMPLVQELARFAPLRVSQPVQGVWVAEFEQNFAGVYEVAVTGPAGTNVTLYAGEQLFANGTVYNQLLTGTNMTITYTLRGTGAPEIIRPTFAFWGSQHLQITGWPNSDGPSVSDITAVVVGSALDQSGWLSFDGVSPTSAIANAFASATTDNALAAAQTTYNNLNTSILAGVQHAIFWSQRSNFVSLPSDCPTREKRGYVASHEQTAQIVRIYAAHSCRWSGDASVSSHQAVHNFDVAAAYRQFLRTIHDTQQLWAESNPTYAGDVAVFSPQQGNFAASSDASWGTVVVFITYELFNHYGDVDAVAMAYDSMHEYMSYLISKIDAKTGIMSSDAAYGDWDAQVPRSLYVPNTGPICATASFALAAAAMFRMAAAIGKTDDAAMYSELYTNMSAPFHAFYYNSSTGTYVDGLEQTPQVMAFATDFVPPSLQPSLQNWLLHSIETTQGGHLITGAVGTRHVLDVLADMGRTDLAASLAAQSTFPSWGWWVTQGATTLWENWSGVADVTHPPNPTWNHVFLGSHGGWLYDVMLGIRRGLEATGYSQALIVPPILQTLRAMSGTLWTVQGNISVAWSWAGPEIGIGPFNLSVTLPPSVTANVSVPIMGLVNPTVTLDGGATVIWRNGTFFPTNGVLAATPTANASYLDVAVVAGSYDFAVTAPTTLTARSTCISGGLDSGVSVACSGAVLQRIAAHAADVSGSKHHKALLSHALERACLRKSTCTLSASDMASLLVPFEPEQILQGDRQLCVEYTCGAW